MLWSIRLSPDPRGVGGCLGVPDPGRPLGARGWRTDFPTWAGGPRWPAASSGTRSPLNNTHTQRCRTVGERKGGPPPPRRWPGPSCHPQPPHPGPGSSLLSGIHTAPIPHLPHSLAKQPAIFFPSLHFGGSADPGHAGSCPLLWSSTREKARK